MAKDDRLNRRDDLLRAARERLTAAEPSAKDQAAPADEVEIRYRGQVVRQRQSLGTPGGGVGRSTRAGGGGGDDVRAALEKVKGLYRDGLISRAEAERKRTEILDRL